MAPTKTSWKEIAPVPTSHEFIDIVLSRTQRRLPTQIRAGFKISRIRNFYTRKVKFTQETCSEKLGAIVSSFPILADIHPFSRDLINTLYDNDHWRVALGRVNTAKSLIEAVSRDYVRLLKLKRAALGRMATLLKGLKDALAYLEQVRMHLGRLPSIDPNTRTLLCCGFPNVGKSSFVSSVSRADTEVQPFAFTTKSLFVGHYDYKYLRFQIIDTPGILDHPLEEMNTIEMQSVVALAHLRAAGMSYKDSEDGSPAIELSYDHGAEELADLWAIVLYFLDPSETCGYSLAQQCHLFESIKPLFKDKIVFLIANKMDIMPLRGLDQEQRALVENLTNSSTVQLVNLSCATQEGVQTLKNLASDALIAERVASKMKAGTNTSGVGSRLEGVLSRIHVSRPAQTRETFIPAAVKNKKKYDAADPERIELARDREAAQGGAGVFNVNLREHWQLEKSEWVNDKIPEFHNGMNVADFIDPEIDAKLAALEEEEERLEKDGHYDSEEEMLDESEEDVLRKADMIRTKQKLIRNEAKMRKSLKNRALIPRKAIKKSLVDLEGHLDQLGIDTVEINLRGRAQKSTRGRPLTRSRAGTEDADAMDVDMTPRERLRSKSRARSQPAVNRRLDGVQDETARTKAERAAKLGQRKMNRAARQGEADRHTTVSLQKHLVAGKRGIGKTSRR